MDRALTVERAIQNRIEAEQVAETIKYGQRAITAMGGVLGCREEYGAADWAIAQFDAACTVADFLVGTDCRERANEVWVLKRAAKIAREQVAAAKAAVREIGTAKQLRLALAA